VIAPENPAPIAPLKPHVRTVHGISQEDPWYWLRNRDDPDTLIYLEAENKYAEEITAPLEDLRTILFDEIKSRVLETDQSVPVPKGDWEYQVRTKEDHAYPVHVRWPRGKPTEEQVLLDENALADGHDYFALGDLAISHDHRKLAYTFDTLGNEEYELVVIDLESKQVVDAGLKALSYGLVWANDAHTLFLVRSDEASRPSSVIRHKVGSTPDEDTTVFEEHDERFWVGIGNTRSEKYVVVGSESKNTSEYWLIDADHPDSMPRIVEPRSDGHEYRINHQEDYLLIVTNDGASDFRLVQAPVDAPGRNNWTEIISHHPGTRLEDVDTFETFTVVSQRRDAVPVLLVIDHLRDRSFEIEMDEAVYDSAAGANAEYRTRQFRYGYTSMVTPNSTYQLNLDTLQRELLKQQPITGDVHLANYQTERTWANAADGKRIPISLVWRPDRINGPAPTVIYGYGSYEAVMPASFSSARLSLLDRGIIFAMTHVRGGGELGRDWYDDGRLANKQNTFTDFAVCVRHLVDSGFSRADQIVARGGSAGGLLMGVIANQEPDLFAGIVAEVPFVDNVNTMLDPSIPLTVTEYDEWGDPNNFDAFKWMCAYSPYENVIPQSYPPMLITAGLNDPRVQYWEPAKWIAKLRTANTSANILLLKTEMGAGHGGPSGRYNAWRDEAFVFAFILDCLNASEPSKS
jgi:oligopeptidase B